MIIDCDTCTVRGDACGDCVVAVLIGAPPALDDQEQRAIGVLAASGLVPPLRLAHDSDRPENSASNNSAANNSVSDNKPIVSDDTPPRSTRAV